MDAFLFDPAARAAFASEKLNKVNLFESPNLFCDVYCLEPGQEQKEHVHVVEDKLYYALSGVCQVRIGDSVYPLESGRLAVAPAGVIHGVRNLSDQRATLLVIMAPHPHYEEKSE